MRWLRKIKNWLVSFDKWMTDGIVKRLEELAEGLDRFNHPEKYIDEDGKEIK